LSNTGKGRITAVEGGGVGSNLPSRISLSAPSFLLCLVLAVSSIMAMLADIFAHQSQRLERRWEQSGSIAHLSQWSAAQSYLATALRFSPGHPDYLQAQGRLGSWRFFVEAEAEDRAASQQGLEALRASLVVRPYWVYGWSELLMLKAQLGEVDGEFNQIFSAVLSTGPNEPRALLNVLNAGLGSWASLSDGQRAQLHGVFHLVLLSYDREVKQAVQMSEHHQLKVQMCQGLDVTLVKPWVARLCRQN
jgi:hypothetical protein